MSVGYLAGAFDLINVRDLDLIAQASRLCSELVVGVFSDDFAERLSGRRPVVPLTERLALVSHVRGVDSAIVHDETTRVTDPAVTCFRVAGDEPLVGVDQTWLLQSSRRTASVALQEALLPPEAAGLPLRGNGLPLRGDDVA